MQAATYSIAVFGLSVVLGLCGQINLAQAAFFGLRRLCGGPRHDGCAYIPSGYASSSAWSCRCWPAHCSAPRRCGSAGHYLAMVTISFQQILTLVMVNAIGFTHRTGRRARHRRPRCFPISRLIWRSASRFWPASAGSSGVSPIRNSVAPCAVRDNELAAGVAGVDVYRTRSRPSRSARCSAASAAACSPAASAYVSPDQFSFAESVVFLTMSLLGGVVAVGSAIGTGLLIPHSGMAAFPESVPGLYLAIYGLAVILIVVFMPDGILGLHRQFFERRAARRPTPAPLKPRRTTPAARMCSRRRSCRSISAA